MTHDPAPPGFDSATWKAEAWSRWSFRNTAQFLPTRTVRAGPVARPLDRSPVDMDPLRVRAGSRVLGLAEVLAKTHATAFMLLHGGAVVAERYIAPMQADDRHMLFSITKSVVGLVALVLIDAGVVDPLRRACAYVPEFGDTAFGQATLADLMAMRDGVAFDETYADPDAAIHRYSRCYWGDAAGGVLRAIRTAGGGSAEPGGFAYRTPVADVVGWVLRRAAGARLSDLVSELLWVPMGAAHDAQFVLDTAGDEIAGAGLNATAGDLARLALLLLEDGARAGRQVLPAEALGKLFSGGDAQAFAAAGYADRDGWSYRDLWWCLGRGRIAALGVHGQRLYVDRDRDFALLRFGAAPLPDNRPADALHRAWLDAVATLPMMATTTAAERRLAAGGGKDVFSTQVQENDSRTGPTC